MCETFTISRCINVLVEYNQFNNLTLYHAVCSGLIDPKNYICSCWGNF